MSELVFKICSFLIKSENSGSEEVAQKLLNFSLPIHLLDDLDPKTFKFHPTLASVVFDDCFDFYRKFHSIPSRDTLIEIVENDSGLSREEKKEYENFVLNCCEFPGNEDELEYYLDSLYKEYAKKSIIQVSSKAVSLLDSGVEDAITYLKENSVNLKPELKSKLDHSNSVMSATELFSDLLAKYEQGVEIQPIKAYFGFETLDKELGGLPSQELILLAGRPSIGKSFIASEIAFHNAVVLGKNVVYSSNEVSKNQIEIRLLSRLTGIFSEKIRKSELTEEEQNVVKEFLVEYVEKKLDNLLIIPPVHARTVESIRLHAEAYFKDQPIDLHVVDHVNKLRSKFSDWKGIEDNAILLKELSQDHDCPVISPTHLSRDGAKAERVTEGDIQYQSLVQIPDTIFGINPHPDYPSLPPVDGEYEGRPGILTLEVIRSRTWPTGYEQHLLTKFATAGVDELSRKQAFELLSKAKPAREETPEEVDDDDFLYEDQ